eukprot:354603-Chlamydomonas_euryale.AAC.11
MHGGACGWRLLLAEACRGVCMEGGRCALKRGAVWRRQGRMVRLPHVLSLTLVQRPRFGFGFGFGFGVRHPAPFAALPCLPEQACTPTAAGVAVPVLWRVVLSRRLGVDRLSRRVSFDGDCAPGENDHIGCATLFVFRPASVRGCDAQEYGGMNVPKTSAAQDAGWGQQVLQLCMHRWVALTDGSWVGTTWWAPWAKAMGTVGPPMGGTDRCACNLQLRHPSQQLFHSSEDGGCGRRGRCDGASGRKLTSIT